MAVGLYPRLYTKGKAIWSGFLKSQFVLFGGVLGVNGIGGVYVRGLGASAAEKL